MLPFYQKGVFELPDGPKNLAAIFPAIDWSRVDEFFVTLKTTGDAVLVTTPINKMGCCCNDDTRRVVFEGALGKWDAVNFDRVGIQQKTTSTTFQKTLPAGFAKTDTGTERFNVRAGETYTAVTACYDETAMPWLMELVRTAKAYLQWPGAEGQADDFLPIVVQDGTFDKQKQDERFVYVFTLTFQLSNEVIIQRN